jgi:hypothetical protein
MATGATLFAPSLFAPSLFAQDPVRVGGKELGAVTSSGFTLSGTTHEWRADPALSLAVLGATARPDHREEDLREAARFALEERLDAAARSLVPGLDLGPVEEARLFHASGSLEGGVLRVPLVAEDFSASSFVGPFVQRLLPDRVLGFVVERPFAATIEASGAGLALHGFCARAYARPLAVLAGSEPALEHAGLPSEDAYFGFDRVTADDEPRGALYAIAAEGRKVELELVDGRGKLVERAVTRPLGSTARLRLVAGAPCRLLADGREVARLAAAFALAPLERPKPVLGAALGEGARETSRFGPLRLEAAPEESWLERATARERARIREALGLPRLLLRASGSRSTVETDLGPASLVALVRDVDDALAAYARVFGKPSEGRLTVRAFGDDETYRGVVLGQGRGEERALGGFFDPAAAAIVMRVDDASPRARLAHEVFHAYAASALGDLPPWLGEGLAEREGLRFAGVPPRHYRWPLEDALSRPRPWRALLTATWEEFHDRAARARNGGQRSLREKRSYVLAWSLCELAARHPESLAAKLVAREADPGAVDEPALDREWLAFVKEVRGEP